MQTDQAVNQALSELGSNPQAFQAGISLIYDVQRIWGSGLLKPGGDALLAQALEATLRQLASDESLAQFVHSSSYHDGFELGWGPVSHQATCLAIIEAGYARWAMSHSGIRFSLKDYYDMDPYFAGDLKDVAGAILGWLM